MSYFRIFWNNFEALNLIIQSDTDLQIILKELTNNNKENDSLVKAFNFPFAISMSQLLAVIAS